MERRGTHLEANLELLLRLTMQRQDADETEDHFAGMAASHLQDRSGLGGLEFLRRPA